MSIEKYLTPCKTCHRDPNDRIFEGTDCNLYKTRKRDRQLVKEACGEHEMSYKNHICKPVWRKCCNILDHYTVLLKDSRRVD